MDDVDIVIVNMNSLTDIQIDQAARILSGELPLGWPTVTDALCEIEDRWNEEDATFIAALAGGEVTGWCGVISRYGGHVFELHPLAVRRDWQRKGVGSKLMREAESIAASKGGLTMWIGADDEKPGGETSFANADLYDDLPKRIREFKPGSHQTAFYMKLGYKIVGVLPDANGAGKPDIFLAKRLTK